MKGLEIPASFREQCSCCKGTGQHAVCSILPQKCETCEGSGFTMNQLGWDTLKLLDRNTAALSATLEQLRARGEQVG
jgi:DnaJ-class molecular chaperone